MLTQPQQQKQHIGGQNSRMLHNLGSQGTSGMRSGLQRKSYGVSNGTMNGGMGTIANNSPIVNETGISDNYLNSSAYANSSKPLQQHFDTHQQPVMQGDGYGINKADSFGSGNFYGGPASVGSMMNPQNLNSVSMIPVSKISSPLISNQSNMHSQQQSVHVKPQQIDQLEKMSFQNSSRDDMFQSHQHQQFQQQPNQFQQQQQLAHHQRQHKQQCIRLFQ